MTDVLPASRPSDSPEREIRSDAAERAPQIAARTLHAAGHFHLDPLWLWDKSDGMERFRATTRSIIALMERNPELRVAASSAGVYEYLRGVDGDLFEQIVERVREGRWEPVGGMW